jgi:F-type H+-transporting ATPase subunit delta
MATRTQVAEYLAAGLKAKRTETVRAAAAWLVTTGRTRQANYLTRDAAAALTRDGYLLARVTTARPLTAAARSAIETFLKRETSATEIELELIINPAVLGGTRIETPTAELDGTIKAKLATLLEGVK